MRLMTFTLLHSSTPRKIETYSITLCFTLRLLEKSRRLRRDVPKKCPRISARPPKLATSALRWKVVDLKQQLCGSKGGFRNYSFSGYCDIDSLFFFFKKQNYAQRFMLCRLDENQTMSWCSYDLTCIHFSSYWTQIVRLIYSLEVVFSKKEKKRNGIMIVTRCGTNATKGDTEHLHFNAIVRRIMSYKTTNVLSLFIAFSYIYIYLFIYISISLSCLYITDWPHLRCGWEHFNRGPWTVITVVK